MGLAALYQKKLVSPERAVSVVKSGDWIDYGQFATQAVVLDNALATRRDELKNVKVRSAARAIGIPEIVKVDPQAKHFIYNSLHYTELDRKAQEMGNCWYIPVNFHEVPNWYRKYLQVDVAMIATTTMDEHGYFNFGPSCSCSKAICEKAKIVIVETNPNVPRCLGGKEEAIHISEVDYIVEADWAFPEMLFPKATDIDKKIAQLIVNEIADGSCLQLGQGIMPIAVGWFLADSGLQDLGIHSEMFCDSMVGMIEAGIVTGAKKSIDRCKVVYTFSLGSKKTYDFINNNSLCSINPVDYTNDPCIIRQNDKVISINNCVEVDLFTQVASESSGLKHLDSIGGQLDYALGAYESKGGKSFICMSSTYNNKKGALSSRVVPLLKPGTIVTMPRSVVSCIVTEYGIADLKGKSTWQRAEAVIAIAHPDFRDNLIKEAEKLGIWRPGNKK